MPDAGEGVIAFVEKYKVPVFPCVAGEKRPITAHGLKDATRDPAKIRAWAKAHPGCNWGMPTGQASGLYAIDLDRKNGHDGVEAMEELARQHGALPETATSITPNDGKHLCFFADGDAIPNSASAIAPGVDVRGDGGYICIPPSQIGGRAYAWAAEPEDVGFAVMPKWLERLCIEASKSKHDNKAKPNGQADGKVGAGGRNEALSRLAFKLRKNGLSVEELEAALLVRNAAFCDPPLPEDEVRAIARGKAGVQGPPEIIVGPDRARLRDVFAEPPKPFPFVIEGILPQDVGVEPAAGGMGKTTRHLYESANIILGRDVWDFKVFKPGPVVIVTAEDFRELYEERVYHIILAMNLSTADRRRVLDNIFIEDLVGKDERLVRADPGGNLYPTTLAETLIEKYRGVGVSLVEFDPLNLLGPGERFVNDGEAATISAARPIARELGCAVRFTHHVSKAVYRDRIVDMYAGRGGASTADNARFVWVGVTHSKDDDKAYPPPSGTEQAVAARRVARIHFEKVSYVPPHLGPIWIERDGYAYRRLAEPREMTRSEATKKDVKTLINHITTDLARGVKHTTRSIEDVETGLPRKTLRAALNEAEQTGILVREELPESERRGSRTYYLRPGAVAAQ